MNTEELKPLKGYWVCVDRENAILWTIATTEHMAKRSYVVEKGNVWSYWEKLGFRCIQVDITFTPTEK